MKYYTYYFNKLDKHAKSIHEKSKLYIREWLDRKEDLESFIFNYIDIDETVSGMAYNLMMANRWYAIALIADELGWEY